MSRLKIDEDGSTYGTNLLGERVCVGARMGIGSRLPEDLNLDVKLRMVKLDLDSGGYAPNGAYFGHSPTRASVYYALSDEEYDVASYRGAVETYKARIQMTCRAQSRDEAKAEFRNTLPNARFYR